ncbi:MAG TPA: two-component regulator propeller domain-containing protein [Cytophagaceae bacterium]|jgi:two-component system sensor histidine kinase ChiS|nr:two-component regulator propeller domain-containing protein [Cytophagaceae bacterium]
MRIKSLFFTLLIIVITWNQSIAQKPPISFQHLKLSEGYSETTTRFIIEDVWGYLWIGSDDGLNKYDGYSFTNYKHDFTNPYSISNNENKEALLDSKGNLWIGTRNGLNLYDPIFNRFYNFYSKKFKCFEGLDKDIENITEDENRCIWITAGNEGLYKISDLNKPSENYIYNSTDNSQKLYGVTSDFHGNLWIGTRDGILKFDTKTNTYHDMRPLYGDGYQVKDLLYEKEYNRLWLSTTSGIKIINLNTNKIKEYKHDNNNPNSLNGNNVIKILQYDQSNYLIGIDGGGIDYFDTKDELFYHYTLDNEGQLSANNVTCIYRDSKKNIWAGTFMNGVDYSNSHTNMFSMVRNNPLSENSLKKGIVTNFLKDHLGNVWVSTDGGGLYFKRKKQDGYISFNPSPHQYNFFKYPILSLVEDKEGIIWMATYGSGLLALNPTNNQIQIFKNNVKDSTSISNNNIRSVTIDTSENIWCNGYYSGISVYNKKTKKFKQYKHSNDNPHSLLSDWTQRTFVDSKGTIWITTFKGLNKYNAQLDYFTSYQFSSPNHSFFECNHLLDIIEASDSNLWIGTTDIGIICFKKEKGNYEIYSTDKGLSNNTVKSIIEDNEKNLWLSTNNGITKFNITTKISSAYTILDGVPPYPFYFNSKYKDEKGRIYLGNSKGFLIISPSLMNTNKNIPPVVITGIKIFGNKLDNYFENPDSSIHVSFLKEIQLNYLQNEIEIDYAALNFINAQRNQYAYMLEGFDEEWRKVGTQRYAKYTNLNPGNYIFHVKGSNNDGVWNTKSTSLRIIISYPWWKSWWFILMEVILLFALLYFLYWLRIRSIRRKNEQLEKIVLKRTEELRLSNEQLEAFIYKASHDIKGPLRSIIGLTTVGQKDVTDKTSLLYFDHILKSTQKLDNLLADLIELTKVRDLSISKEQIHFRDLINEVLSRFEHFDGINNIQITVMVKELVTFYSDKTLLNSIIQNLIENPIKYRDPQKENSYLDIAVLVTEQYAELKFSDNGIGIPLEIQNKVFEMFFKAIERSKDTGLGLYIVKTSVDRLNGTIKLDSKPGVGSTFIIRLPH